MSGNVTSTGRGGAGNIGVDPNTYVDGAITRSGPEGDQGDGAYSAGRGGAGNINSPSLKATKGGKPGDADVIPDAAIRHPGEGYDKYHTGRGGQGNIHKEHPDGHQSVGEKVKDKVQNILHKKD